MDSDTRFLYVRQQFSFFHVREGKTPPRVLHLGCEFVLQFRHSGCARGLAVFSQLATSTKQLTETPRKWPTVSITKTGRR